MNARSRRLLRDLLIAVVSTAALAYLGSAIPVESLKDYQVIWELLPIVWVALRHGSASAVISAILAGSMAGYLKNGHFDLKLLVVYWVLPLTMGAIAGLFARNTHRTLNNRRYSSVRLNIATGTLLSAFMFMVIKFVLAPFALYMDHLAISMKSLPFWGSWLLSTVVVSGILFLVAHQKPNWILPRRSKYLSSYETSSLLND